MCLFIQWIKMDSTVSRPHRTLFKFAFDIKNLHTPTCQTCACQKNIMSSRRVRFVFHLVCALSTAVNQRRGMRRKCATQTHVPWLRVVGGGWVCAGSFLNVGGFPNSVTAITGGFTPKLPISPTMKIWTSEHIFKWVARFLSIHWFVRVVSLSIRFCLELTGWRILLHDL